MTSVLDSDQIILSTGLGYAVNSTVDASLSYTHVFFRDGGIDRTDPLSGIRIIGNTERSADVVALAVKIKVGQLLDLPK